PPPSRRPATPRQLPRARCESRRGRGSSHGHALASTFHPSRWDDVAHPAACGDLLRRSWLEDCQKDLGKEIIDYENEDACRYDRACRGDAHAFRPAGRLEPVVASHKRDDSAEDEGLGEP